MKYKLTLSYDGTRYGGWQVQPNTLSIQSLVQDALQTLLRTRVPVTASGRTDAGVHALAQVAHFNSESELDARSFLYSLNGILPRDIRVRNLEKVPDTFHARFSSKKKIYHYHIEQSVIQDPFNYLYSAHIKFPLDLDLLKKALPHLLGTHDFSSFASSGCGSKNPVKTLHRLDLFHEKEGLRLEFEGDGFLYKMVRNIVGTLLEVAKEKICPNALPSILSSKDRRQAGPTAPPKGLFLVEVKY